MVDAPLLLLPQAVDEGVEDDLGEGNKQGDDQPDVYHFHIGCGGKAVEDADEEGRQDKKGGEVNSDNGLIEEGLEVVCAEADKAKEHCGQVCSQNCSQNTSSKMYVYFYCRCFRKNGVVGELKFLNEVLCQFNWTKIGQVVGFHFDKFVCVSFHHQNYRAFLAIKWKCLHVKVTQKVRVINS